MASADNAVAGADAGLTVDEAVATSTDGAGDGGSGDGHGSGGDGHIGSGDGSGGGASGGGSVHVVRKKGGRLLSRRRPFKKMKQNLWSKQKSACGEKVVALFSLKPGVWQPGVIDVVRLLLLLRWWYLSLYIHVACFELCCPTYVSRRTSWSGRVACVSFIFSVLLTGNLCACLRVVGAFLCVQMHSNRDVTLRCVSDGFVSVLCLYLARLSQAPGSHHHQAITQGRS